MIACACAVMLLLLADSQPDADASIEECACVPRADTRGVCFVKQGRNGQAVRRLLTEIDDLNEDGARTEVLTTRFLWLGAAYLNAGHGERLATEAFMEAMRLDPGLAGGQKADPEATAVAETKKSLGCAAGGTIAKTFATAIRQFRVEGSPQTKRVYPRLISVRLGVMSGFTFLRPDQPAREQQPLALNVYAFVGHRDLRHFGIVVGTGASPNLPPAGIVAFGWRPAPHKPIVVFLGGRWGTQRIPSRWTAGIGVDFRLWR